MLVWCSSAAVSRLPPEPDQRNGPSGPIRAEHLQRYVPSEALLHRLVDDPHPPTADLAKDPIVAQPLRRRAIPPRSLGGRSRRLIALAADPLHHRQRREQLADLHGQLRVPAGVLLHRRLFPPPVPFGELVRQLVEPVRSGLGLDHGQGSSQSPPSPFKISFSRRGARCSASRRPSP